ncbi:hypothetical protein Hdeb2414_s0003g00101931 [Helianthus debilis subsp. tardiflorus]
METFKCSSYYILSYSLHVFLQWRRNFIYFILRRNNFDLCCGYSETEKEFRVLQSQKLEDG